MEECFKELDTIMKRIEACDGAGQGRMIVNGTVLAEGKEIIRTSIDGTTTLSLLRNMEVMKDLCNHVVREQIESDKVNFIRIDYKDSARKDTHHQIMMGVEDTFKAIVIQEYEIRDLRQRSNESKEPKDYKYFQKNPFFPTIEEE